MVGFPPKFVVELVLGRQSPWRKEAPSSLLPSFLFPSEQAQPTVAFRYSKAVSKPTPQGDCFDAQWRGKVETMHQVDELQTEREGLSVLPPLKLVFWPSCLTSPSPTPQKQETSE